MKRVKLYTLKVENVDVSGDFVEVSSFNRDAHSDVIKIRNSDEFVLSSAKVHYSKIPIEKYCSRYISSGWDTSKEYLVAFDPEIIKILQTKEKGLELEVVRLKRDVEMFTEMTISAERESLSRYENVIRIVTMSFWDRLKFLFLGSKFKFFKESE